MFLLTWYKLARICLSRHPRTRPDLSGHPLPIFSAVQKPVGSLLPISLAVMIFLAACSGGPSTPTGTDHGSTSDTTAGTSASETTAGPTATPTPSPSPSPSPTPTPPITDPAQLDLTLTELPGYVAAEGQGSGTLSKTLPDAGLVKWSIFAQDNSLIKDYQSPDVTAFGDPETFTGIEGVLTFRGNNYRNAPAFGSADISENKLEVVWTKDIGAISGTGSYWPGAGWTGQPLLVHWPEETRQVMGITAEMKAKDLVEVIYPVFDGHIYFLDLETGLPTREPINVGYGFKGTGSVDPRGYPLFYAGQGLNDTNGRIGVFRYRIFDLIQNIEVAGIAGKDAVAYRSWGAFDSSALINWQTDTLIEPGENGLVYKVKLNTVFDVANATVSVNPEITKMRYSTPMSSKYGIESSLVAYRNLVYFSDNDGALICMDINTMEVVWFCNVEDDSDATMVLEETDEGVFLYHGNTVDKRGTFGGSANDVCNLRKINALTGQLVWQYDVPCVYESYLNGGMLATPLLGRDDFADIVIFNVCKTTSHGAGTLLAIDKKSGQPVWTRALENYSWSSPIAITGDDGKSYGILCDSAGIMHLFDPLTGQDLSTLSIGANCEASPSAYNNMIVVATYAQKIYGIRIS